MKKLLSVMFALVISLAMIGSVSAALVGFDIQTSPDPIMAGEGFQIDIEALNENGTTFNLTDNIHVTVENVGYYTASMVNGVVSLNTTAPLDEFDITAEYNTTNTTITRFGLYDGLTVTPNPMNLAVTTNYSGIVDVFTLTNGGSIDLTDVALTFSGTYSSRCDIYPVGPYTINAGSYEELLFGFDITGLAVGTYTVNMIATATGIEDITVPITIVVSDPVEEKLFYIDEIEINGEKIDVGDYENGDDIELDANDVYGEDLEVIITLKNDDDQDMDDVELEIEIEDIDDEDDWEDDEDIGTIKDDEEEEVTFTSSIDWTPDEDTFTVHVYVVGEGEDDEIEYEDEWTFDLKIDKEDDDVAITEAEFDYETVELGDIAYLTVEVTNIGSDDQDEVVITVECDDLDLDFKEMDIELDEGDSYDITIPIEIDDDFDVDDYDIEILAYYDYDEYKDDDPTDVKQVTLSVVGEEEEEEEEEETSYPEYSEPEVVLPEETGYEPQPIPTTTEISFSETTGYTLLLVLGNVLLVVLIIFLLIKLLR